MPIRSHSARRTFLLAAMVVMVAASASAQVPDVVLVGETACPITCPNPLYQVEWFGPTYGHRIGPNLFKVVEIAPGGRLYGLLRDEPSRVVEVLRTAATLRSRRRWQGSSCTTSPSRATGRSMCAPPKVPPAGS